jgi:hypothetical protein
MKQSVSKSECYSQSRNKSVSDSDTNRGDAHYAPPKELQPFLNAIAEMLANDFDSH